MNGTVANDTENRIRKLTAFFKMQFVEYGAELEKLLMDMNERLAIVEARLELDNKDKKK